MTRENCGDIFRHRQSVVLVDILQRGWRPRYSERGLRLADVLVDDPGLAQPLKARRRVAQNSEGCRLATRASDEVEEEEKICSGKIFSRAE